MRAQYKRMSIPTGKTELRSHVRLPQSAPRRRALFAILITVATVCWAAKASNPVVTLQITSPNQQQVTDRYSIALEGAVHSSSEDPEAISVVVNQDSRTIPVTDSRFQTPSLPLRPGHNLICAFLDDDSWDVAYVTAPRLAYHFDHGTDGWSAHTSRHAPLHTTHISDGRSGGFLSAQAPSIELQLVFVVDGTQSMRNGYPDWNHFAQQVIQNLRDAHPNTRVGLIVFRDRNHLKHLRLIPQLRYTHLDIEYARELSAYRDDLLELCPCQLEGGGGQETEDLFHGIESSLTRYWSHDQPHVVRHIIAITDAASTGDESSSLSQITRLAQQARARVHAAIIHPKPIQGTLLYDEAFRQDILRQNEVNERIAKRALQTGQALARSNQGECVELMTPSDVTELDPLASKLARQISTTVLQRHSSIRGSSWVWRPPAACAERLREAYGEFMELSLHGLVDPRIVLQGKNQTLTLTLDSTASQWQQFRIPLQESPYWQTETGAAADLRATLNGLVDFRIESRVRSDHAPAIDRFIIVAEPTAPLPHPHRTKPK